MEEQMTYTVLTLIIKSKRDKSSYVSPLGDKKNLEGKVDQTDI